MPDSCDNILACCPRTNPLTYDSADGVVPVPPPLPPDPVPPDSYCNVETEYTAECPVGYTGDPVTKTIPADTYCASTQSAANQLALAAAIEQANAELECTYECADEQPVSYDIEIAYTTVCSENPGTFNFTGSNTVRAYDLVSLHDIFTFEENWDGNCPLGWLSRTPRAHTAGSLELGPYSVDMVIFAATQLFVDDTLVINGETVMTIGQTVCNNKILYILEAGQVATVQAFERGGAWCFAAGYLGVAPAACVAAEETGCTSPEGWCDFGTEIQVSNLVPVMTSNTTPSGVASGANYPVGGEPWRAFNGNAGDGYTEDFIDSSTPFTLGYQFPQLVEVTQWYLKLELASPADVMVTLQGSQDGATWKDLDSRFNSGGGNIDETYVLTYAATHIYFRVSISTNSDPEEAPAIASITIPTLALNGTQWKCCPNQTSLWLNETITYDTICDETPGPFDFISTNTVRAIEIFDLTPIYYYTAMWDGICPVGSGRDAREHPSGDLVIGPYAVDTQVRTATNVFVDDVLLVNGVGTIVTGEEGSKNRVLCTIAAGDTATIKVLELYGAHCFACGYLAVVEASCAAAENNNDPSPPGW